MNKIRNAPKCLLFLILLSLAWSSICIAQTDSLQLVLTDDTIQDSTRIKTTIQLANKLYVSEPRVSLRYLRAIEPIISTGTLKQQIDRLHYFGNSYHYLNNVDSAEYYHTQITSLISKEDEPRLYARAKSNLGIVEEMRGNLSKAVSYYEESMHVFEMNKDTFPLAATLNNLGLVHDKRGDYQNAKESYMRAFAYFKAVGHESAQSSVLTNLGKLTHSQKNYEEAIAFYKKSYALAIKNNKKLSQGILLDNIGATFIDIGKLDSAAIYLEQGLQKRIDIKDNRGIGISYSNLGNLANRLDDHEKAIFYYKEAKVKANEAKDSHTLAFVQIGEGTAYKELNQRSKAINSFTSGLEEAKNGDDIQLIYKATDALYHIYKGEDQPKALQYLELSTQMKDSIMNEESIKELANLEMQYKFNQKEILNKKEIENLELRDQIQKTSIRNQRWGLGALGLILGLILYMFKNIFSKNKKIEHQNQVIGKALEEKNTLLKEIHHRVKNNLQVISSLLKIQSRFTNDGTAIDALRESESRVRSMALIHQDLYQKDNLTGIKMNEYLDSLIQNIFSTYNISKDRISIKTDIEDIELDVDTVIPLGLIINELVSNGLKYAFPDDRLGTIYVRLYKQNKTLLLEVEDNGIGIQNVESMETQRSFGYSLIRSFQKKLDAELKIESEEGTKVQLLMKVF